MAPTDGHDTDKMLGRKKNTNQDKKNTDRRSAKTLGARPGYMRTPTKVIDLVVGLVKASMKRNENASRNPRGEHSHSSLLTRYGSTRVHGDSVEPGHLGPPES